MIFTIIKAVNNSAYIKNLEKQSFWYSARYPDTGECTKTNGGETFWYVSPRQSPVNEPKSGDRGSFGSILDIPMQASVPKQMEEKHFGTSLPVKVLKMNQNIVITTVLVHPATIDSQHLYQKAEKKSFLGNR